MGVEQALGRSPTMLLAMRIWLTILVCWPAPAGPCRTMVLPRHSNSGRTRSNTAGSPPTMIDSRASRAPTSPPDTGASRLATPRARAAASISRASEGSLVVMSTSTAPAAAPASAPSAPSTTSRTSCGKPTMVKTTSARAATARGESAHTRRARAAAPARAAVRVKTVTRMSAVEEMTAHRRAHDAGADPADARRGRIRSSSSCLSFSRRAARPAPVVRPIHHRVDGRQVGLDRDPRAPTPAAG